MSRWAVYFVDGRIESIYTGSASEASLQARNGLSVIPAPEEFDDSNAYVRDGVVQPCDPFPFQIDKPQIVADGNDTVTISNVPVGTTIIWHDGQEDVVNDGQVQLSTDLPGTYTLTFDAVPFLRQEVTIEAVAAT